MNDDTTRIPVILVIGLLTLLLIFSLRWSEEATSSQPSSQPTISAARSTPPSNATAPTDHLDAVTCENDGDCQKLYDSLRSTIDVAMEPTRFECKTTPTDLSGQKSCYAILETRK